MAVSLYQIAVDAHDLRGLARFWCGVLDWEIVYEHEREVIISSAPEDLPGIVFLPVPEGKAGKNRLHLDVTPLRGDRETESRGSSRSVPGGSASGRATTSPGPYSRTRRGTSSAC